MRLIVDALADERLSFSLSPLPYLRVVSCSTANSDGCSCDDEFGGSGGPTAAVRS